MIYDLYHIPIIIPVLFISGFLLLRMGKKLKFNRTDWFLGCVLTVYLIGVLKYTLFPITIDAETRDFINQAPFMSHVNLNPFKILKDLSARQVILNVVMTFPLGVILPLMLKKNGMRKILGIGVGFGVLIESLQLIVCLLLGYAYREIDIDDVMLNTLGTVLGYCSIWMMSSIVNPVFKESRECDGIVKRVGDVKAS